MSDLKEYPLKGKTALVTGASRGIGQAIAIALANLGAKVIGTATSEKGADAISAYFQKEGVNGIGKILNIDMPDTLVSFLQSISPPDILVNNAGITRDNLLLRMKDEEWHAAITTNLTGIYHLTKHCIKHMIKARWGRIINISSISGIMGNPGQVNYSAAKAGIIGFSKSLALEVASRNITVNVVAPGFIQTDMTQSLSEVQREALLSRVPSGRLGEPTEVAAAVAFLATPSAAYITGETLQVNGGMYMQ